MKLQFIFIYKELFFYYKIIVKLKSQKFLKKKIKFYQIKSKRNLLSLDYEIND